MKPFGRIKTVKGLPFKKDVHPQKGYINWWEDMCSYLSRGAMKLLIQKEIDEGIKEWDERYYDF